ncbi:MAG: response regulator [Alphaproteobacteria bacterium]
MAKILIVEDHPIFRRGVKDILTTDRRFTRVGEVEDANKARERLRKEHWDAMILDISLPGVSGLEFMKEVKLNYPDLPVLVLSVQAEDQYAIRMLKAGASGYLTKDRTAEDLLIALSKLLEGKKYLSEALGEQMVSELQAPAGQSMRPLLSDREFEVLRLIAQGMKPHDIGRQLHLSPRTIGTYRARLLDKLHLKSNAQLTQYAIENDILKT